MSETLPPLFVEVRPADDPFEAARQGDMGALRSHIEAKSFPVNQTDTEERTALHWAAASGHTTLVEYLLAQKAQPQTCDEDSKNDPFIRSTFDRIPLTPMDQTGLLS